jgi:glucose-6-phosphate dehydrogenase assembly protein OpcA
VNVAHSHGPGITVVSLELEDGQSVRLHRPDGRTATLSQSGASDRVLPLQRRDLGDLIGEELRRLDPDEPYGEALGYAVERRRQPRKVVAR